MKVFGPNSLFKPKPKLFKYKACLIPFNSETTQGAYFSDKHLFEPKMSGQRNKQNSNFMKDGIAQCSIPALLLCFNLPFPT